MVSLNYGLELLLLGTTDPLRSTKASINKVGYADEVLLNGAVVPNDWLPSLIKLNYRLELLKQPGYGHEKLPNGSIVPSEPVVVDDARTSVLAALEAAGSGFK